MELNRVMRQILPPDLKGALEFLYLITAIVLGTIFALPAGAEHAVKHVFIYHQPGRFAGFPANHGIWNWGNEILVGFSAGDYKDLGPDRHAIDREKPEEHLLARSLDGGETWVIENPGAKGLLIGAAGGRHGTLPSGVSEPQPTDCPGGIDFAHPDFAMTCRMAGTDAGQSRFCYSYDRGHHWKGPFHLPLFGQPGIAARTDYIVDGPKECHIFLTASKSNRREGRVICAQTVDAGKSWLLLGQVGPEPEGYSIMPSSVRLTSSNLLTTIRCRAGADARGKSWIEAWFSPDNGQSWSFLNRPVADTGEGNPPHLMKLMDGRVCLTYGVRAAPFRICATLSSDGGRTWSVEKVLRDDGGNRDLGYVRSIQRPDGKAVTVYYFWDQKNGPERYLAATIWDPR